MANASRGMSFLPTIKCSMCARDIEISQMGDHVCSSGEATPPPDAVRNFDGMSFKPSPTNGQAFLKPGRAMPPRVDTSAANRSFFPPQEQLTPVSLSPSRSASPMSPSDRSRSPFGGYMRNSPVQRSPPSPEPLSSNLDSPFPPFPTSKPGARGQQGGGYGSLGDQFAEPNPMYAPMSPRDVTAGGLLQRMNTIAPGPFDINGRQKGGRPPMEKGHQRKATGGSLKDMTMSSGTRDFSKNIPRPGTAGAGHSRTSTNSSTESQFGYTRPRVPRNNGYGGFGPPPTTDAESQRETLRPDQRSQTYPLRSASEDPSSYRRPSESSVRTREPGRPMENERSVSGSPPRQRKRSVAGPDLSRPLPPRGASLVRSRTDDRLRDAPPIPSNINLAVEFGVENPYHTSSESQSSVVSGYSEESKASSSSRSSPPSTSGRHPRRKPSDTSKLDKLMSEVQLSMMDLQTKELPSAPSPPRNKEQYARAPPRKLDPSMLSPESPMDSVIRKGSLSPVSGRNPSRQRAPLGATPEKAPRRPTTSKGNCKGCGELIKGKSVSSADGRLSGRYHKECFVCNTCSAPFQTSTFYVINDAPYCERHYHKLNGSVCVTCDKGIEGQYLESERRQKYHPGCLTCADCKRSLRNDYFEMNGQVYCERDAFRRAQQGRFLGHSGGGGGGGGSNRMERRTTRLMVM